MGILGGLRSWVGRGETRAIGTVPNPAPDSHDLIASRVFGKAMGICDTETGTELGLLRYTPVSSGLGFRADAIGTMPLPLYNRYTKERATDHWLHRLLNISPNGYQTPSEFKGETNRRRWAYGNAYVFCERNGLGEGIALRLLDNTGMQVSLVDGVKLYTYKGKPLASEDVVHLKGPYTINGITGETLMCVGKDVIDLGRAVEGYALRFFRAGGVFGKYLHIPPTCTPEQVAQVMASFIAAHTGEANQWTIPCLPYGAEIRDSSTLNTDAMLLQLREYQTIEAARLVRLPPYVLQHYANGGTYANIESQGIDLIRNSLQPDMTAIEQGLLCLLNPAEREQYYLEFTADARLRGDTLTRYQAHAIGRTNGWLSVNDIRRMENLPPIAGGDDYLATPVGATPNAPQPAGASEASDNQSADNITGAGNE